MTGGYVIETILTTEDTVWINCRDKVNHGTCGIYVPGTEEARSVSPGDTIWWHGFTAYWTPVTTYDHEGERVGPADIEMNKIGYSTSVRPKPSRIQKILCQMPPKAHR